MSQSFCETEKDGPEAACGSPEPSACAINMEKEQDSCWSPVDSPALLRTNSSSSSLAVAMPADPQGYDVEFDPPLESKYECPICLMALRAAVQTPCGHRFCHGCIRKSLR